jgi:hypothetical protein
MAYMAHEISHVLFLFNFNFDTVFLNITMYFFGKYIEYDFFVEFIHSASVLAIDTKMISETAYCQFILKQTIWKHLVMCILAV